MEQERDREFIQGIDSEVIEAMASVGRRGGWADSLTKNDTTVVISCPVEIDKHDPDLERLRQYRDQVLVLVRRRDNGPHWQLPRFD